MQPNNPTRATRILRVLLLFVALVAALGITFLIQRAITSRNFRLVSSNPAIGQVATVTPFLDLHFNRQLATSGFSVSSSPQIISKYAVSGENLNLTLTPPFTLGTTYTITITNLQDTAGKTLATQKLSFKPNNTPETDLPKDQQQVLQQNQITYNQQHSDPIVVHLPYSTTDFNLSSSYETLAGSSTPKLVLHAQLLIHGAQANNPTAAEAQDTQEVQAYIQSLGLDPANYDIEYTTAGL